MAWGIKFYSKNIKDYYLNNQGLRVFCCEVYQKLTGLSKLVVAGRDKIDGQNGWGWGLRGTNLQSWNK